MGSTAGWPIEVVPVSSLVPDPRNVRIKDVSATEKATIAYLYGAHGVLDLARNISVVGYFDNEVPIVTQENGRDIVLEGNRRVSALKGLLNPASVPTHEVQLSGVVSRISNFEDTVPSNIRVMRAPDRASAQYILAQLHTTNPKVKWGREQQAAFYHAQLSPSLSVGDLKVLYPTVAKKIPEFITMAQMLALLRSNAAFDKAAADFVSGPKFTTTSFEYLFESARFRKAMKMTVDSDGLVTFPGGKPFTKRVFIQIAKDLASGFFSTRTPAGRASDPAHQTYVDFLVEVGNGNHPQHPSVIVKTQSVPTSTSDTAVASDSRPDARASANQNRPAQAPEMTSMSTHTTSPPANARVSNRSVHDKRLYWDGLTYNLSSAGLRERFQELERIDVSEFPNATMDMIRTFLECSLKEYFRQSSNPLPTGSYVQLRHCLDHAAKHFVGDKRLTNVINNLRDVKGSLAQQDYLKTAQALNGSNHEPDVTFSRDKVNQMWVAVHPLIAALLKGPIPSP